MGKVTHEGKEITLEPFLYGVQHWAQWSMAIPKYEVFLYLGHDGQRQVFYFQSRKTRLIVSKKMDELIVGGFKPFLLNIERLKAVEGK